MAIANATIINREIYIFIKKTKKSDTTKSTTKPFIENLEKLTNQDLYQKLSSNIHNMPIDNMITFLTSQELKNLKILKNIEFLRK